LIVVIDGSIGCAQGIAGVDDDDDELEFESDSDDTHDSLELNMNFRDSVDEQRMEAVRSPV